MADTVVRCTSCGREEGVSFADSLREGWPKCCGQTMRLLSTDADPGEAVGEIVPDRHPLETARLKDKALVAEFCLRLDAAREYGFVEGGPEIDIEAARRAISEAKDAGITYNDEEIDQVIRREVAAG